MDEKQQLEIATEKVKQRYARNFLTIKEMAPSVFKKINAETQADWRVIVNEDGSLNAIINGQPLYPYSPTKIAEEQVDSFRREQTRYRTPYMPVVRSPNNINDALHYEIISNLESIYGELPSINYEFPFDGKNIPVIIVFGMGFGYHVIKLIREFNIQHMVIIEPDPVFLKLSLYSIDWKELIEHFSKSRAKTLNFILSDDPRVIKDELGKVFGALNPAFITNVFFFEHFASPVLDEIFNFLKSDYLINPTVWGIIDSELKSLEHCIDIAKYKYPVYLGEKPVKDIDIPVFLIGSGPSLDALADTIKKFSDKALIVSCGTAISSLYRLGIRPDFHMIADWQDVNYELLKKIDKSYMREVNILGTSSAHPKIFKLGKKRGVFLTYKSDVSSVLWDESVPRIKNAAPTVTAAALSLFAHMGFRKFFLFGIDLGTRDVKLHHSVHSDYYEANSPISNFRDYFDIEAEGNFGGKVYTKAMYISNRTSMENTIKEYKLEVFNLSDGLKISGAKPLKPEDMHVSWNKNIISVEKQIFLNYRTKYNNRRILDKSKNLYEDLSILTERFKPYLKDIHQCSLSEFIETISDLHISMIKLGISRGIMREYELMQMVLPTLSRLEMLSLTAMFGLEPSREMERFGGSALNTIYKYFLLTSEELTTLLKNKKLLPI